MQGKKSGTVMDDIDTRMELVALANTTGTDGNIPNGKSFLGENKNYSSHPR